MKKEGKRVLRVSVRETLRRMDVGESVSFNVYEADSGVVRNMASKIGKHENKKFTVHRRTQGLQLAETEVTRLK